MTKRLPSQCQNNGMHLLPGSLKSLIFMSVIAEYKNWTVSAREFWWVRISKTAQVEHLPWFMGRRKGFNHRLKQHVYSSSEDKKGGQDRWTGKIHRVCTETRVFPEGAGMNDFPDDDRQKVS